MALRPRRVREEQIAAVRDRGLPAVPAIPFQPAAGQPAVTGAPTGPQSLDRTLAPRPAATVNIDPLGIGAEAFEKRMAEIREFSATSPELQFQRESAIASRQPTPEARAATLAGLTQQRLGTAAEERIQALRGQSEIGAARERAVGTAERARLEAEGREEGFRFKEIDALNDSIFDQQKLIDEGGPGAEGHRALRDRLIERRGELQGIAPAADGEGAILSLDDFIADFTTEQGVAPSQAQIDRAEGRFWR